MKSNDYHTIPKKEALKTINIPGIYCKNCGASFALYSFSIAQAHGFDENDKAFYEFCPSCPKTENKNE